MFDREISLSKSVKYFKLETLLETKDLPKKGLSKSVEYLGIKLNSKVNIKRIEQHFKLAVKCSA